MARGGYATYIKALSMFPCTAARFAAAARINDQAARRYMNELCKAGLARPVAKEKTERGNTYRLVYGPGVGLRYGRQSTIASSLALLIGCAKEGMSTAEVSAHLGICSRSVNRVFSMLKRAKLLHISGWRLGVTTHSPVYTYGPGRDAPKPKKTPRKVTNARYWAARKAKLHQLQVMRALAGCANADSMRAAA